MASSATTTEPELRIRLIDVSHICQQTRLESLLDRVFDEIKVYPAAEWNKSTGGGSTTADRKLVTRFVKQTDRFLALSSILLQSRALVTEAGTSPVLLLPRTEHRKPFLPSAPDSLSISHQYPFAASVQLFHSNQPVGLDIVVFDPYNPRLYDSVQAFAEVFRSSFSAFEYDAIQTSGSDNSILEELYLRWAVKEAYTKALGVGLGFDFGSFETRMNEVERLHTIGDTETLEGTITQLGGASDRPISESWTFYFRRLDGERQGCLCAAWPSSTGSVDIKVEWTTIEELIDFHTSTV